MFFGKGGVFFGLVDATRGACENPKVGLVEFPAPVNAAGVARRLVLARGF